MKLSTKEIYDKRVLGVDNLTLDKDNDGNKHISVVVNLLTGLCKLYPIDTISADNTVKSVLSYMCDHGLFDEIRTDPGVDYTSKLMNQFETMFGFIVKLSSNRLKHVLTCFETIFVCVQKWSFLDLTKAI